MYSSPPSFNPKSPGRRAVPEARPPYANVLFVGLVNGSISLFQYERITKPLPFAPVAPGGPCGPTRLTESVPQFPDDLGP